MKLNEYIETKEFELYKAGYIKEDGSFIILDEYHGEDKELQKLQLPEFSNTHPEEDTCIRIYKKPNKIQLDKIEEIIDLYLDREEYCKIEIFKSDNSFGFYKIFSLYEGACELDSNEEIVGN